MAKSKIEWTEESWNPVTGCTKISPGCQNCYAAKMAKRLQAMGQKKYKKGFEVVYHEEELKKKFPGSGKRIFVCSMSDLFHRDVPDWFISRVLGVIRNHPQHTFIILTKRPERITSNGNLPRFEDNIIFGVSVESFSCVWRLEILKKIEAKRKFVSFEPFLTPIKLPHNYIVNQENGKFTIEKVGLEILDWVIVGAESGPGARPMELNWVRKIRDKAVENGVPFFFKQRMENGKKISMPELDGRIWAEYPEV